MGQASTNEDHHYWRKWIEQRDTQAGDFLIRQYMPLVTYHVQRISTGLPRNVQKEDLKSFGLSGLFDALEKYDHTRDLKFETYASFRIRGAILDGLRKEDWLPRSVREKYKKIEQVTEKLEQKYLRNVTAEEVGKEIDMSGEEVEQVISEGLFSNVLSVEDQTVHTMQEEGKASNLKDKSTISPEEQLIKNELYNELVANIKKLNKKEQLVISLFYQEELTLTEIGQVMELSTSRISQIHSKALYKLKATLSKLVKH